MANVEDGNSILFEFVARSEKDLFTGDAGGKRSGSRPEKETGDALVNPPFEKDRVNGKAPRRNCQGAGQCLSSQAMQEPDS